MIKTQIFSGLQKYTFFNIKHLMPHKKKRALGSGSFPSVQRLFTPPFTCDGAVIFFSASLFRLETIDLLYFSSIW